MTDSSNDPLGVVGETLDGRYLVKELVDEGGFGYVYKATRLMWDNPVAVKFFKTSGDAKRQQALKEAFIQEGALLSELSRKTTSIVQSRDVGTATLPNGQQALYTVLEWLEGTNLAALLAAERRTKTDTRWAPERIVEVLGPIARALGIAHGSGVAHRDIKPSNIFLVQENNGPLTPKLLDFGIAKVVGDLADGFNQTATNTSSYTPAYGAPEQFSRTHGPTGPWTDVYALAIVTAELLLGYYPLQAETLIQVVSITCDPETRPTPNNCGGDVSAAVDAVFQQALALRTEDRYRSVSEFWGALMALPPFAGLSISEALTSKTEDMPLLNGLPNARAATLSVAQHTTTPHTSPVAAPTRAAARRRDLGRGFAGGSALALALGGLLLWKQHAADPTPTPAATAAAPARESTAATPATSIDPERLASFSILPTVATSATNELTPEKVELGRKLFFDKRLSQAGDLACTNCHDLTTYGVDNRRVSVGHAGQLGTRNSLSVYNVAGSFALMWDGSVANIEEQAKKPLLNPREMANTEEGVVKALSKIEGYRSLFASAFPTETKPLSFESVAKALAAFERGLFTPARWDKFLAGDKSALTDSEKIGFNTFAEVGCLTCHYGAYVGLTSFQKLGLLKAWPDTKDRGRFEVTQREEDWMMFRVPTLRNVEKTDPYFHDGSVSQLETAIELMGRHQLGKELKPEQVARISDWLKTLTGEIPVAYIAAPELP